MFSELSLITVTTLLLACQKRLSTNFIAARQNPRVGGHVEPEPGGACLSGRRYFMKYANDSTKYLYCDLSEKNVGSYIWISRSCNFNKIFDVVQQECVMPSLRSKRRHEASCLTGAGLYDGSCYGPVLCLSLNVTAGATCDWTSEPLEPLPNKPDQYLQCNPLRSGNSCGVWNQMQCIANTQFDRFLQVCISLGIPIDSCHYGEVAMFPCGQADWCPTSSQCRNGVCCYQNTDAYPNNQYGRSISLAPPTLKPWPIGPPSAYYPSHSPSNVNMPQPPAATPHPWSTDGTSTSGFHTFQPWYQRPTTVRSSAGSQQQPQQATSGGLGLGSYPHPRPGFQRPYVPGLYQPPHFTSTDSPEIRQQPNYPIQPVIYSAQPETTDSYLHLGQPSPPSSYPNQPQPNYPAPRYPGQIHTEQTTYGQPEQTFTDLPYPFMRPGYTSERLTQPAITPSLGLFTMTSSSFAVCSLGNRPLGPCTPDRRCPNGQYCSPTHVPLCCPLPICPGPGNNLATAYCTELRDCLPTHFCYEHGCCPVQMCSGGEAPIFACDSQNQCPSPFTCQAGGGCCPPSTSSLSPYPPPGANPVELPRCPDGRLASQACDRPGTCPVDQFCHTDSSGVKRGCCYIPKCPDGMPSMQPCGDDRSCPMGLSCIDFACCDLSSVRVPTDPAQNPSVNAQPTTPYPTLYPAMPLVPEQMKPGVHPYEIRTGGHPMAYFTQPPVTATAPLARINQCTSCCPNFQVAVCFCAGFNMCPQMTVCGMHGACCAAGEAIPLYTGKKKLGEYCIQNDECPTGSSCSNNHCVCQPHTASNGLHCVPQTYQPQVATGYRIRRRHLFSRRHPRSAEETTEEFLSADSSNHLNSSNETGFVYWRTFGISRCVTDNECIPEMMCIEGQCFEVIESLNDEACEFDEQCQRLIPFSMCLPDGLRTVSNVSTTSIRVCKCGAGFYEHESRCLSENPEQMKRLNESTLDGPTQILFPKFDESMFSLINKSNSSGESIDRNDLWLQLL